MIKDDSKLSAETKVDNQQMPIHTTSSQHSSKPAVVGSQSKSAGNDIWSHPLNKGLSQHHIDNFNAALTHLDSYPKNEKGQRFVDGEKFFNFMESQGAIMI